MTTVSQPPGWLFDPGYADAIDMLLAMSEAEHRWGDSPRALGLLDHAEPIVGTLPEPYGRLRRRCRRDVGLPAAF